MAPRTCLVCGASHASCGAPTLLVYQPLSVSIGGNKVATDLIRVRVNGSLVKMTAKQAHDWVQTHPNDEIVGFPPSVEANVSAEQAEEAPDFEEMTVAQLRDYAEKHSISLTGAHTKADAVDLITSARAGAKQ